MIKRINEAEIHYENIILKVSPSRQGMPIGHKHLSSQSQIITSGLHLDEPSFICPQDTFLFTFRAEVFPSIGNIQWRLYYWGTKWTVDKLPTQSLARVRPCLAPQHDIEQCLFCRRRFDWRKPLAKLKLDAPSPESEAGRYVGTTL